MSGAYGEDEVIPLLGSALATEYFLVESLAQGADGVGLAGQHGGNVLGGDAELDEQTGVVLHIGHGIEALQLGGEAGIDGHQAVLHLLPVGVLHQLAGGHAAHEGGILVGGEEGVLDRLGGLAHGRRSVLLHVANLLQLELHLMAAATIDHVVGHGDDDDEGSW